ncbi:MAG: hypothetical protein WA539_12705, partial [Candidatus Sulfotelmatobacter sp.]
MIVRVEIDTAVAAMIGGSTMEIKTELLRRLIGFIGFRRKQELNAEITEEISLIAARGFEAASGHKEKYHRAMNFVARSKIQNRLGVRRMEDALGIELHVPLEFGSEIVAKDEAGNPAVWAFVDKLIT